MKDVSVKAKAKLSYVLDNDLLDGLDVYKRQG